VRGLLRGRLTYANVMSTIAVFGVLAGGGAYAASKIGAKDIKRNAVRSKQIKNRAVAERDLNRSSVGRRFGAGLYFGQALDHGPISPNTGSFSSVPIIGEIDFDSSLDREGGPFVLLPPIPVRARDLRFETLTPVERSIELQVLKLGAFVDTPVLRCRLGAGETSCRNRGRSAVFGLDDRLGVGLDVPIAPGTLGQRSYAYSLRLVPG